MNVLSDALSSAAAVRLGWTLLHSAWQFACIAVVLCAALTLLRRRSANVRYVAACLALLATLASSVVTFHLVPDVAAPRASLAVAVEPGDAVTTEPPGRESVAGPREDLRGAPFAALPVVEPADSHHERGTVSPLAERSEFGGEGGSAAPPVEAEMVDEAIGAGDPSETTAAVMSGTIADVLAPWLSWVSLFWIGGVAVLSLRNLGGWIGAQRLRRVGTGPIGAELAQRVHSLCARMTVSRPVRVLQSTLVEIPIVVGWLRPVVLLPASLVTGLSASQLEAILAHELAHVRRHDYLVNLLQTVAETLLFYHPGVWWISRQVRLERENCCDDAAVRACGSNTALAEALAEMEASRLGVQPVMAATGNRLGFTLRRVRRLLEPNAGAAGTSRAAAAVLALALLGMVLTAGLVTLAIANSSPETIKTDPRADAEPGERDAEAARKRQSASIRRDEDAKRLRKLSATTGPVEPMRPPFRATIVMQRLEDGTALDLDFGKSIGNVEMKKILGRDAFNWYDLRWDHWDPDDIDTGRLTAQMDVLFPLPAASSYEEALQQGLASWKNARIDESLLTAGPHSETPKGNIKPARFYIADTDWNHLAVIELEEHDPRQAHVAWRLFRVAETTDGSLAATPIRSLSREEDGLEYTWGDAVEGVQCRLEPDKTRWAADEIPTLKAYVRHLHDGGLWLSNSQKLNDCRLEVDGVWYEWGGGGLWTGEVYGPSKSLEAENGYLDAWGADLNGIPPDLNAWQSVEGEQPLRWTPGKHTIRFAWTADQSPGGDEPTRLISNAVDIEILPRQEFAWGEAADGVQCRLRPEKVTWPLWDVGDLGTAPKFTVDVRSRSRQTYSGTPPGSGCDVYVEWDGKWHEPQWGEYTGPVWEIGPGDDVADEAFSLDAGGVAGGPDGTDQQNTWGIEPTPGWHTIRIAIQLHGEQAISVVSNPVKIEILPSETADEPTWGEAVEGVQCRLEPEKARWVAGEVPKLTAYVRDPGKADLWLANPSAAGARLQIDGQWYRWGGELIWTGPTHSPCGQRGPFAFALSRDWLKWSDETRKTSAKDPLKLSPGKHSVRFAYEAHRRATGDPNADLKEPPLLLISNPVEIEILPAEEPAWGEPVEGVQCRLRTVEDVWPLWEVRNLGKAPKFKVDLRSQADQPFFNLSSCLFADQIHIEWDGKWYKPKHGSLNSGQELSLEPGDVVRDLDFSLDHGGVWGSPDGVAENIWGIEPTAGWHTVRIAVELIAGKKLPDGTTRLSVVSNPVKIQVVPPEKDAGEAGPAWGEAVEGVQCRLEPEKARWAAGEVPKLTAYVRDSGKSGLWLENPPEVGARLQVDGQWYRWGGEVSWTGPAHSLCGQLGPFALTLSRDWLRMSDESPLRLSPGKHSVRFAYEAHRRATGDPNTDLKDPPVLLFSNPVAIEILPAKQPAWGEPVEGVQCRLEAEKTRWAADEAPKLTAYVRDPGKSGLWLENPPEAGARLQIDGQWYRWGGVVEWTGPPSSPCSRRGPSAFTLTRWWQKMSDKSPLKLSPGKHSVRFAYEAHRRATGTPDTDPKEPLVLLISNPVAIEIAPAKEMAWGEVVESVPSGDEAPKAAPSRSEPAWGEVVDGLQAGLATAFDRARPCQIGQDVPLRFLLRNTTGEPITLTHPRVPIFINSKNPRHPPGPQLFDPDGKRVFPAGGVGGYGLPGNLTRTIGPGEVVTMTTTRLPLRPAKWDGGPVNLLAYAVKPGKHRVSLSWTFGDQGGKQFGSTVTTGTLDLDVQSNDTPLPIPGTPWGEYKDGIRCRLNVDKTRLELGELPILLVDLQNKGQRTIEQLWHALSFTLQIDGKWTGEFSPYHQSGPVAFFGPGQEWINVPLVLQGNNYHMAATSSAPAGPAAFSQLLGPGRHTIRVNIDGVVSNPVTIEVVPEEPAGAAFGPVIERVVTEQPSKATTYLDLDTSKYAIPEPGNISAPIGWLRDRGVDLCLSGMESERTLRTAVDMVIVAYTKEPWRESAGWTPEQAREFVAGNLARHKPSSAQVINAPGTYAFRTREGNFGIMQLLPPPEDKPEVTVRYKLLKADVAEADATAWGPADRGVQVRLCDKPLPFREGEAPVFRADVRNQGNRDLHMWTIPVNGWEIEVDGRWYRLSMRNTLLPQVLSAGSELENLELKFETRWRDQPVWLRADDKKTPLQWSPGKHTVRLAVGAYDPKNRDAPSIRAETNPFAIEIAAEQKAEAYRTDDVVLPVPGVAANLKDVRQIPASADWPHPALRLRVDARNDGQYALGLPENGLTWQIEVDGRWYEHVPGTEKTDAGTVESPSHGGKVLNLNPGRKQENLTVNLAAGWWCIPRGKEVEYAQRNLDVHVVVDPHEDGGHYDGPLNLTPGTHRVRVAPICDPWNANQDIGTVPSVVRVVSNVVEVTVVRDEPAEVDVTAWGSAVDGIVCAVTPVRASFAPDEDVVADVIYRSVSDKPITVCVHPDPFYTWVHLSVKAADGSVFMRGRHANGFRRPLTLADFVTLKPGQTASFRQVIQSSPHPERRLPPGRYFLHAEINKINRMDRHMPGFDAFCQQHGLNPWVAPIESGKTAMLIVTKGPSETEPREGTVEPGANQPTESGDEAKSKQADKFAIYLVDQSAPYSVLHGDIGKLKLARKPIVSYEDVLAVDERGGIYLEESARRLLFADSGSTTVNRSKPEEDLSPEELKQRRAIGRGDGSGSQDPFVLVRDGKRVFAGRLWSMASSPMMRAMHDGGPGRAAWIDVIPEERKVLLDALRGTGKAMSWGEAVRSVQCGLRADRTQFKAGEVPTLAVGVCHREAVTRGTHSLELEVDGRWYRFEIDQALAPYPLLASNIEFPRPINPEYDARICRLWLNDRYWLPKDDNGERNATDREGRMRLTPGKHVVRVAVVAKYAGGGRDEPQIRALSKPIEIEVVAEETPDGDAADPNVRVIGGSTKDDAISWGKPVDGLQLGVSFVYGDRPYVAGKRVGLQLTVRNNTAKTVELADFTPIVGWAPTIWESDGETKVFVNSPEGSFPVQRRRSKILAGETWVVGRTEVILDPAPHFPARDYDTTPRVKLAAGNYRIGQTYRFDGLELTSGELELTVAAGRPPEDAKEDHPDSSAPDKEADKPPPSADFQPVISRTVSFDFSEDEAHLDLDTGRFGKEQPGNDVFAAKGESSTRVRSGLDMVAIAVDASRWNSTPNEVLDAVARAKPQRHVRLGGSESRQTFFFKTREGGVGVLRITPAENNFSDVVVRYKMLARRAGENDEANEATGSPTRVPRTSRAGRTSED